MSAPDSSDVDPRPALGRHGPVPIGVSIEELKGAWNAIGRGDFRTRGTSAPTWPGAPAVEQRPPALRGRPGTCDEAQLVGAHWVPAPGERVLPVVGCHGSAGATTLALAVAEAAPGPARMVECASRTASGLEAASTAELGVTNDGLWREGRRGNVTLLRAVQQITSLSQTPAPPDVRSGDSITVIDCGCQASELVGISSWLNESVVNAVDVVVVTSATAPGLRRLESALELLDLDDRAVVAVLGPGLRRWPPPASGSIGPRTDLLLRAGRYVAVPIHPSLHASGVDSAPLPSTVVRAARDVLALTRTSSNPSTGTHEGTDR